MTSHGLRYTKMKLACGSRRSQKGRKSVVRGSFHPQGCRDARASTSACALASRLPGISPSTTSA